MPLNPSHFPEIARIVRTIPPVIDRPVCGSSLCDTIRIWPALGGAIIGFRPVPRYKKDGTPGAVQSPGFFLANAAEMLAIIGECDRLSNMNARSGMEDFSTADISVGAVVNAAIQAARKEDRHIPGDIARETGMVNAF